MTETYPYSEIFYSIQGEGKYTGVPTVWLRYFGCNLQCNGFGQKDPTKPETYVLPYQDFDVSKIEKVEDLPVWKFGCDSSYSWSKKYKHLAKSGTSREILNKLYETAGASNFKLPHGNIHLCFTGGEPFIPRSQKCTSEIFEHIFYDGNIPDVITFESNGTKPLIYSAPFDQMSAFTNILFSVSPKLWTVAGEKNEKAIRPDIVQEYARYGDVQLKFVMGPDERQWEELLRVVSMYECVGFDDIWIMPVSGTVEGQQEIAGQVATKAIQYGFRVSARVHCYLWGNAIGT